MSPSFRKEVLTRKGPHFVLDRSTGSIEFGATVKLKTELDAPPNSSLVNSWLLDIESVSSALWDPNLSEKLPSPPDSPPNSVLYRLSLITLQFFTLTLSPTVDCLLQTRSSPTPIFYLTSISFDPNVTLLPGMTVKASDLSIEIDVVGQMKSTSPSTGCVGAIGFQTRGILPPPLRVLPERVLRDGVGLINDRIVEFARGNFEKGARKNFKEWRKGREEE
ncbi:hypothetical protein TrVE_jg3922 [Triparma verrucosa]|uniref:Uncharacterized protein n=1 Tax=Triparma verrucosa TaxID=1606542 RepID=A0A9W7C5W5_9STRA|nr:hypothetical protein TrVE_jg3922 [Triparma verrucosa]